MLDRKVNGEITIDEHTMALLGTRKRVSRSIIIGKQGTKYSTGSPITLLNDCCKLTGTMMLGSMDATTARLGIKGYVPFIVNPFKMVIVMPTHSLLDRNNVWIFP